MKTTTVAERILDFTGQRVFVGLDVHNKTWHASVYCEDVFCKSFTTDNAEGVFGYLTKTFPNAEFKTAYEAGYCGFAPYRELLAYGLNPIVVNPADVPTTDKEKQNKTDIVDSKKLADNLKINKLKAIYVPSIEEEALRDLLRQRDACVKKQTQIKNQIKAFLQKYGIKYTNEYPSSTNWSNSFIEYLKNINTLAPIARIVLDSHLRNLSNIRQEIKTLEKFIKEVFHSEKHIENFELIKSVPGIGDTSAAVLLSEIIDIKRFKTFDELNSYCGFCPKEHSSGETKKVGSLCKRRNARINKTLIESAWVAIRIDQTLTLAYNKLIKKNIKPQKAIVKIARKLLRKIMMVLKTRTPYITGLA